LKEVKDQNLKMTETRVEADVEKEAIKTEFKKQVFIPGLWNPGSALFGKPDRDPHQI
jgi:hypothetical protein